MRTVAETIGATLKADVDRLVGIAVPVEEARAEERRCAAAIACQRRYWPFGRLIARAIMEERTWPRA